MGRVYKSVNWTIIKISLIIFCLSTFSFAQKGSVSGTVIDEHGAVIPGTRIEFINEKGRVFSDNTNADGEYRIELESGLYSNRVANAVHRFCFDELLDSAEFFETRHGSSMH